MRLSGVIVPESSNCTNPVRSIRNGVPQQRKQMKKYRVTLYYHSSIDVEVEADNEKEAIEEAYCLAGDPKYDAQLISNVQEDADPDVEEITEER